MQRFTTGLLVAGTLSLLATALAGIRATARRSGAPAAARHCPPARR